MYDIIVVGAGPAGATFARLLDKRFKTLVIDKKSVTGGFQKPCGGLLAPRAQRALAELGDTLPKDVLANPQIFAVETIDLKTGKTRYYPREYVNMDRHKFDLWLMSKIGENVTLENGTVKAIKRTETGYDVCWTDESGKKKNACSKFIVGADGANSIVRRTVNPKHKCRRYTSIQQWFENENERDFYACVFDRENTDCYSWALTKDGKFIFGGAYPEKNARAAFERQKAKLSEHGWRFGEPVKTEACLVLRPKKGKEFYFGENDALLIGEAAGLVSPSGLEGISSAILSGQHLAKAFNESGTDCKKVQKRYLKNVKKIKYKLLLKLIKCIPMYHPLCRKLVMWSGLTSIELYK